MHPDGRRHDATLKNIAQKCIAGRKMKGAIQKPDGTAVAYTFCLVEKARQAKIAPIRCSVATYQRCLSAPP